MSLPKIFFSVPGTNISAFLASASKNDEKKKVSSCTWSKWAKLLEFLRILRRTGLTVQAPGRCHGTAAASARYVLPARPEAELSFLGPTL